MVAKMAFSPTQRPIAVCLVPRARSHVYSPRTRSAFVSCRACDVLSSEFSHGNCPVSMTELTLRLLFCQTWFLLLVQRSPDSGDLRRENARPDTDGSGKGRQGQTQGAAFQSSGPRKEEPYASGLDAGVPATKPVFSHAAKPLVSPATPLTGPAMVLGQPGEMTMDAMTASAPSNPVELRFPRRQRIYRLHCWKRGTTIRNFECETAVAV